MTWNDLEKAFRQAWMPVFSKRKLLLSFISLSLCGLLMVFCRALARDASSWMNLSLLFLPILLSSGFLLTQGVLIIRMYTHEVRGLGLSMRRLFAGSLDVAIGTSYLSFPPVFAYLGLWILLGLFFLLKEIPLIGPFFNVVFAFGPFLLIFSSLILCLVTFGLLFFIAPAVASHSIKRFDLRVLQAVQKRPFQAALLFFMGLLPALFMAGISTVAAVLTNASFAPASSAIALEWFFVMLPFCALMTPPVIFFFHFASESYELLRR